MMGLVEDYDIDENSCSSTHSESSLVGGFRSREKREPVPPYVLVYFLHEDTYAMEKANLLIEKKDDRVVGKKINASFKGQSHEAIVLGMSRHTADLAVLEQQHKKKIAAAANDTLLPAKSSVPKGKGPGRPRGSNKTAVPQPLSDPNNFILAVQDARPCNVGESTLALTASSCATSVPRAVNSAPPINVCTQPVTPACQPVAIRRPSPSGESTSARAATSCATSVSRVVNPAPPINVCTLPVTPACLPVAIPRPSPSGVNPSHVESSQTDSVTSRPIQEPVAGPSGMQAARSNPQTTSSSTGNPPRGPSRAPLRNITPVNNALEPDAMVLFSITARGG